MTKDAPDQKILFTEDESDMLFFSGLAHDPATLEVINDFTPMLGEEGEEFIIETAAPGDSPAAQEPDAPYSDDTFDVTAIVAAAEESAVEDIPPADLAEMLPEAAEGQLDLDLLFDAIQVGRTSDMDIPDYSKPAWMDRNSDLQSLSEINLDTHDIITAADNAFKNLISSDES